MLQCAHTAVGHIVESQIQAVASSFADKAEELRGDVAMMEEKLSRHEPFIDQLALQVAEDDATRREIRAVEAYICARPQLRDYRNYMQVRVCI